MSLSKPESSTFTYNGHPISEAAELLVNTAIKMKPTISSFVEYDCMQFIMDIIPAECANELTRAIVKILKRIKRFDLLPLVSHPACDVLEISYEDQLFVPDIISNIGFLSGLKTLKLRPPSRCDDYRESVSTRRSDQHNLSYFIRHLTKLTVLHLPNICTTEILQSVITSCPLLEDLDIRGSEVDVSAIRDLAKCKNLKYLNVDGVGGEADLAPHVLFLLRELPNLLSIGKFDLLSVLDIVDVSAVPEDIFLKGYKLESAFLRNTARAVNIIQLFQYFPNLEKIESEKEFGSDLECLLFFPNLNSITITGENVFDLHSLFSKDNDKFQHVNLRETHNVTELFRTCSFGNLSTLELDFCTGVDLDIIAKSAPYLTKLTLDKCATSGANTVETTYGFSNLLDLSVTGMFLSYDQIRLLLENCNELSDLYLEAVHIYSQHKVSRLFSNELFYELVEPERKRNLRSVKLRGLGSTCRIVKYLLDNFSSIKYIGICDYDSVRDVEDLAIKLDITNSLQIGQTRNVDVKLWCVPPSNLRHAIENANSTDDLHRMLPRGHDHSFLPNTNNFLYFRPITFSNFMHANASNIN